MEAEGPLWQRLKGTAGRKAKQVTFILDMLEYTFYVKVIVLFKKTNKLHSILFWCQMAARYVQAKKNVWYNLCFVFSMQEGDVQRPVQASCEMNINSLFFFSQHLHLLLLLPPHTHLASEWTEQMVSHCLS